MINLEYIVKLVEPILVMKISEINVKTTFVYIIAMQSVLILFQVSQNKVYTFFREK